MQPNLRIQFLTILNISKEILISKLYLYFYPLFRHSFYEKWPIDSRANDGPIDDRATTVFTRAAKLVTSVSKPVYRSKREMENIVYDGSVVEELLRLIYA